jgi:hypothetical protein
MNCPIYNKAKGNSRDIISSQIPISVYYLIDQLTIYLLTNSSRVVISKKMFFYKDTIGETPYSKISLMKPKHVQKREERKEKGRRRTRTIEKKLQRGKPRGNPRSEIQVESDHIKLKCVLETKFPGGERWVTSQRKC